MKKPQSLGMTGIEAIIVAGAEGIEPSARGFGDELSFHILHVFITLKNIDLSGVNSLVAI